MTIIFIILSHMGYLHVIIISPHQPVAFLSLNRDHMGYFTNCATIYLTVLCTQLNKTGTDKSAQSFSQKNCIENVDSLHSARVIAALITALPAMTPLTFAAQFFFIFKSTQPSHSDRMYTVL